MIDTNDYTCNECGRVHRGITMESAISEVECFNETYENLTAAERERYFGGNNKITIESFTQCFYCNNNYKNFRPSIDSDCESGVTLTAIVVNE